jgi:hypothetical protein
MTIYRISRRSDGDTTASFNSGFMEIVLAHRVASPMHEETALERRIDQLPTSADIYYGGMEAYGWTTTLKSVLEGTREQDSRRQALTERDQGANKVSPLSYLRDHETTLLRYICSLLLIHGRSMYA